MVNTLSLVDNQENVTIGGKMVENYGGVIHQENFKISPFRKVIEKLFSLRQKSKDEGKILKQGLVKLVLKCLYRAQIRKDRKDIKQFFCCESEHLIQTEYDENVFDQWRLSNGNYIVKMKKTTD